MKRPNKLEGLSLETLSSQFLYFEDILRARPEPTQLEHLSDASSLGKLLVLPANVKPDWKVIARYQHSNLFGHVVSNKGKKFYNIDTRMPPSSSSLSSSSSAPPEHSASSSSPRFQSELSQTMEY